MGPYDTLAAPSTQLTSQDRVATAVLGEFVRVLTRRGWICHRLAASPERKVVGFTLTDDDVLSAVYVVLASVGEAQSTTAQAGGTVLAFIAEVEQSSVDLGALTDLWRATRPQLVQAPHAGDVRIAAQLTTVEARTSHVVQLDQYMTGDVRDIAPLIDWTIGQADTLREQLRPLKR